MANKRIYDLTEDTTPSSGDFLATDKSGNAEATKVDVAKFAILAGQSGGQTLYGDTAANGDLILHGTSSATRTTSYVLLQPTAGNVGIGTTAPGAKVDIAHQSDTLGNESIRFTNNVLDIRSMGIRLTGDTVSDLAFDRMASGVWLEAMRIQRATGYVGIGKTAPVSLLHANLADTGTNTVATVVTVGHNTSGTPAAGFGAGISFLLGSSTTADQPAAIDQVLWATATHGSRAARRVMSVYDTAARECIRMEASGSAAMLGFFGANAVAKPTGVAVTDAAIHAALVSLGLIAA